VKVGDVLVIPKGSVALGTVTEAQAKRRMARGGRLNINIDSVRLINGDKAALRAVKEVKGGGHTGAMTGGIVATSLVFFPAAPFFLFMHGKDITIPKGTEVMAYVNGNLPLDRSKIQSTLSAQPTAIATAAPPSNASLEISSSPPGADIELDGSFAGNTPSSLGVGAGEHTVKIAKLGYKPWERKIRTSSGNVKLAAELETVASVPASTTGPASQREMSPTLVNAVAPAGPPSAAAMLSEAAKLTEPGSISITSTPDGADIFVDSVGQGHTPAVLKLSAGKHALQLVMSGYKDWTTDFELKSGSSVDVAASLEK
jgi:hypothetical protein